MMNSSKRMHGRGPLTQGHLSPAKAWAGTPYIWITRIIFRLCQHSFFFVIDAGAGGRGIGSRIGG